MVIDKKKEAKTNCNNPDEYYFQVWKYYEEVAMHFNALIIKLRIQSIGGLAALATILGIFLHSQEASQSFKCGLAVIATFCLMLLWIAIWILDMCYYNRLLEGSVNAILNLERDREAFLKDKKINLSTNIEDAFKNRFPHESPCFISRLFNSRNRFYLIVFCTIFFLFLLSLYKYFKS